MGRKGEAARGSEDSQMKTKDRDRIRISTQMAEFLAGGGKVKCCDHTSNASYGQPVKRTRKDQVAYTKKHNRIRG